MTSYELKTLLIAILIVVVIKATDHILDILCSRRIKTSIKCYLKQDFVFRSPAAKVRTMTIDQPC